MRDTLMTRARRWPRMSSAARRSMMPAILAIALGGCATMRGSGAPEEMIDLRIRNTLIPPATLSISVLSATGAPQLVGTVDPSETEVLTFDPALAAGRYRLLAELNDGSALASRQFYLGDADAVEWNVGLNTIRVIE